MTFTQRYNKHSNEKQIECPKCKAPIIMIHGCGWDNDAEWCSSRMCDYEVIYDTTTLIEESEIENEKYS